MSLAADSRAVQLRTNPLCGWYNCTERLGAGKQPPACKAKYIASEISALRVAFMEMIDPDLEKMIIDYWAQNKK